MVNFRYWGYSKKTIFYRCKALNLVNSDKGGSKYKILFYGFNALEMKNITYRRCPIKTCL